MSLRKRKITPPKLKTKDLKILRLDHFFKKIPKDVQCKDQPANVKVNENLVKEPVAVHPYVISRSFEHVKKIYSENLVNQPETARRKVVSSASEHTKEEVKENFVQQTLVAQPKIQKVIEAIPAAIESSNKKDKSNDVFNTTAALNSKRKQTLLVSPPISEAVTEISEGKNVKHIFEEFLEDSDNFDEIWLKNISLKLNLTDWKRCYVVEVSRNKNTFDLVLQLKGLEENKENECSTVCHLQGPWCRTKIESDDCLFVKAIWDDNLNAYKVDKDHGICITNPDTLISGTTVVGSLFCQRRGVLQNRFSGIDACNKAMVVGTLVHSIFQAALERGVKSFKSVDSVVQEFLSSQETAFIFYGNQISREEVSLEIQNYTSNIVDFIDQYIEGREPSMKDQFQGTIAEITDIEENLWIPQLGLKGKVDVKVRVRNRKYEENRKNISYSTIPLELKTGKATFSLEHRGQLMLYQMMLTTLGEETNSGLLLYLREGIMKEIHAPRNDQRDLISLRNDLTYYIMRVVAPPEGNLSLGADKLSQPFELPDPISHHSACSNCPYSTICSVFGRTDSKLHYPDSHPWQKVVQESTSHLKAIDYEYFIRWCGLLSLEEQETKKLNPLRSLWLESPEARQQNGNAIINLKLNGKIDFVNFKYVHLFQTDDNTELRHTVFSAGEYVIISSRKRIAIASGHIFEITCKTVSITSDKRIPKHYFNESFIIDKYESQSSNVFNFTNLGILLENTEGSTNLRSIVIAKQTSKFSDYLPKIIVGEGAKIVNDLNSMQKKAIIKALTTENFILIKGLPGTGKTQTLVAIVRLLHLMGKSVLITSHTHSAVDNLLLRLKPYSLRMIRLGSRFNSQLQGYSEAVLTANCRTEGDIARAYSSANIVGVTCLGSGHSIFLHRKFDVCIVDEATQVLQATVLRPLFFCEKFILVGDPEQLPPLIRSREARSRGADESLFHRLDSENSTFILSLQYRMNRTITKLANDITYEGSLQCAGKEVEMATIPNGLSPKLSTEKWLQRTLHPHLDQAVFFLDTKDCSERSTNFAALQSQKSIFKFKDILDDEKTSPKHKQKRISKYTNFCEAAIVFNILKFLLMYDFDPEKIGVIAPYRAQVDLLKKFIEQYHEFYSKKDKNLNFASVEVNTVDQYQGRDKDIIIYSCAKTGSYESKTNERSKEIEILEDNRRLTVAVTRAKHKLIIIGDAEHLRQYTPFHNLLSKIPSQCKLVLEDGRMDFNWTLLLDSLNEVIS